MPTRITNEIVDIPLNGVLVKGILNGDESSWSFQSLNKSFLMLFPDGVVNSYTYLDASRTQYEHHMFQLGIAAHMQELLRERRVTKPQRPACVVRRYVAP